MLHRSTPLIPATSFSRHSRQVAVPLEVGAGRRVQAAALGLAAAIAGFLPSNLNAQCTANWVQGEVLPGVRGGVRTMLSWDSDGAGPAPSIVVVGGAFDMAGTLPVHHIAAYDPASGSWSAIGGRFDGAVNALTSLPNGNLVAGGVFTSVGGVAANGVAVWDGMTWSALGAGANWSVNALAALPNGDVVAAGYLPTVGSVPLNNIARWNGVSWLPLGSGMNGGIFALTTLPGGDVVAGGAFTSAGGVPANNIARWNGVSWSALGSGVSGPFSPWVGALTTLPNGDLVAGGDFASAGGVSASLVARWNGSAWSAIGSGASPLGAVNNYVSAVVAMPNGDLVVGGGAVLGGSGCGPIPGMFSNVARWDGVSWSQLSTGMDGSVNALAALPGGDLLAGGGFSIAGTVPVAAVARWNGTAWLQVGAAGIQGVARMLTTLPNGDLIAGGGLSGAGTVLTNWIARWDGASWSALGAGLGPVTAVTAMSNGDVAAAWVVVPVGCWMPNAAHISVWNGTTWSLLGSAASSMGGPLVSALKQLPNGDLVVSGDFVSLGGTAASGLARWNGTSWSAFGSASNWGIAEMAALPNGDLVVAGNFTAMGGVAANNIARWDGVSWSPFGAGCNGPVFALAVLPNGDLVAGGSFTAAGGTNANSIAQWNGAVWSPLGPGINGVVQTLTVLPNTDLVAAGAFATAGAFTVNNIARWDGAVWTALGSGTDGAIDALTTMPDGTLVAAGAFTSAGGFFANSLARWAPTCPAGVQSYGVGCSGPGGQLTLAAGNIPWSMSTLHVTAFGFGPTSVGLAMVSVGQALPGLPLQAMPVPGPGAGCILGIASLDLIAVMTSSGAGTRVFQVPIAIAPTAPGLAFYLQAAELDLNAGWVGTYTTNALTCTVGTY